MSDVEPIGPGTPQKKKSKWKYVGIGCGIIVVLLIIGVIILATQGKKIFRYTMGKAKEPIIKALPADIDREEAERVINKAFDNLMSGKVQDMEDVKEFNRLFKDAFTDKNIDQEEALELYEVLQQWAGETPAEGDAAGGAASE